MKNSRAHFTDLDPERSLLGGLLGEQKIPESLRRKIRAEAFSEHNRLSARAILSAFEKSGRCDLLTVSEELVRLGGGLQSNDVLMRLAESAPVGADLDHLYCLVLERNGAETPTEVEAPEEDLPTFPEEKVVKGLAGEIANRYAEVLESPVSFLFTDALAYLGALVCTAVRIKSEIREEPRLYALKLGPSAYGGKSVGQESVERLYWPLFQDRVKILRGVGSAEGLAFALKAGLPTVLNLDELRGLIEKMGIKNSVLLTMLTSLFSATKWANYTKDQALELEDAHLSLVGSCTLESFRGMFCPEFRAVGLLNRLWIVAGRRRRRQPIPDSLPVRTIIDLRDRIRKQVETVEAERPLLEFAPEARRRYTDWYMSLPESQYSARLDAYSLRFLTLYTVTREDRTVSLDTVDAVIHLMDYQKAIRRELDPIDADSAVARMESAILRQLTKGRMGEARLMRAVHVERHGLWCYGMGLKNLVNHRLMDVKQTRAPKEGAKAQGRAFSLTPAGRQRADTMEGR